MRKIIKLFENGNVSVCGLRGRGKDMLMANVVVRRKKPYCSNIDYGGDFTHYKYEYVDIGNSYENFVSGKINKWTYPLQDGTDIYLSDAGVYFPSQFCGELNKRFPSLPSFMALCRHLGNCNLHFNSQALNRVWDKIREQSDTYIQCRKCIYIKPFKLVFQIVRIYEKYDSAVDNIPPFRVKVPLFASRDIKSQVDMQREMYYSLHGKIKTRFLIYRNKSNYDTRYFKTLLGGNEDV